MKEVILAICLVSVMIILPASAGALGGSDADPVNQIVRDTQKCQAAMGKLSLKFATQIVKGISRCFDEVLRCDRKADAAAHDECIGRLLVVGRGKCAIGKLSLESPYMGPTSAATTTDGDRSVIGRAYFRFIEKLGPVCIGPAVDLSTAGTGLGLDPAPASKTTLAEALNSNVDGRGIACSAHKLLNDAYPLLDEIVDVLLAHPNGGDSAIAIGILDSETGSFSECR